ncbi:MAG: hypothetical protein Q8L36_00035 [bacterium]|nr:hypothetical protein [bacterium]
MILAIALLLLLVGCESLSNWLNERDFDYAVNNRANVPIFVIIDGERRAPEVPANTSHTFRITHKFTDSWDDGRNGTIYIAAVNISAECQQRSPVAWISSETRRICLYSNKTVSIEFENNDFEKSGPGLATFEVAFTNNTDQGLIINLNGNELLRMGAQSTISARTPAMNVEFSNNLASVKVIFSAFNGERISKPKELILRTDRTTNLAFTATDW